MNQAKVNLVLPVTTDTGNKQYLYLIGNIARQCQTIVITKNEVNDNFKAKDKDFSVQSKCDFKKARSLHFF